jgi:hypothetical protein
LCWLDSLSFLLSHVFASLCLPEPEEKSVPLFFCAYLSNVLCWGQKWLKFLIIENWIQVKCDGHFAIQLRMSYYYPLIYQFTSARKMFAISKMPSHYFCPITSLVACNTPSKCFTEQEWGGGIQHWAALCSDDECQK